MSCQSWKLDRKQGINLLLILCFHAVDTILLRRCVSLWIGGVVVVAPIFEIRAVFLQGVLDILSGCIVLGSAPSIVMSLSPNTDAIISDGNTGCRLDVD